MPSNAEKLLEKARRNKAGWSSDDLLMLYKGFGFNIRDAAGSHKFVSHPKHAGLTAVVPEHAKELGKKYVSHAVKNIDKAIDLEKDAQDEQ